MILNSNFFYQKVKHNTDVTYLYYVVWDINTFDNDYKSLIDGIFEYIFIVVEVSNRKLCFLSLLFLHNYIKKKKVLKKL